MKELVMNILTAGIHGSIIIGVILLLRPVLKKAPKNTLCLLWLLACLRLLLPFEIQSSFSLQPELDAVAVPGAEYVEQVTSGFDSGTGDVVLPPVELDDAPVQVPDIEIIEEPEQDAVIYEVQVPLKVKILENYEQILVWLWAVGAAGLLIYSAVAYVLMKRRIRSSVILSEGVWACGSVESAFVLGFFRPQIYLSANLPEDARDYVLAHERCHIRRGDHWWKLLGYLTLALHWFNPLVWLAYSLLCRDLEMACDEAVVKTMSVEERKSYSAALLTCSTHTVRIAACPVAFGEVSVKQRIKRVLRYRRPGFWVTIVAVAVVAIVAVCFLTSPKDQKENPTDPTEEGTQPTQPTEATQSEADLQEELIQRCRDAMIKLQKAEVGYRHTVNMTDPNRVINTCLYDSQYWCFQYRRPGWDYQDVIWLTYEDKTYSFEGDTDSYGTMSAIHYWKPDEDADKKPFVVYPLNLDWKTIPLNYLESSTDLQGQTVTLEYPHYNPFTFCFDSTGELLWYEIGDSSGEAEATTTRTYVQYPGDSISSYLIDLYNEAVNTVNENELVYTDGFYQSMFMPEASPLNAAELFYGFYQNPQRFIDRLAAADKVNPSVSAQVIECMRKEANNYAPYLLQYILNQFPDTFYPEILGGLKAIFAEPEQENQLNDPPDENDPLEKCRSALRRQQAKDYFQIMDNCFFSAGEGGNHSGSTLWYIYKNSALGQSQSEDPSGMNEWWNLNCDGIYYHRIAHASEGPQFGLSWESDWSNGQFQAFPLPTSLWPLKFDFASADVTLMEANADEYGESITFSVFGDPLLQGGTPQRYTVTFHLNTHGVLQRVQMQYLYGDAQVERILVFRTTTREEVIEMIDQCHAEALLHTRGICTDPECTDKAHDHSGVKCTDDHCDNPTHHHSSHH